MDATRITGDPETEMHHDIILVADKDEEGKAREAVLCEVEARVQAERTARIIGMFHGGRL
jgi:hypothetical protein